MVFLPTFTLLLSIATTHAAKPTTVVDLGYAKYEGSLNNQTGNIEFLGIRFAAAPTGSLRWREPQPPQATPGIQKADVMPNMCWQGGVGEQPESPFPLDSGSHHQKRAKMLPSSEDCLFLNVATPASSTKDLPVVVWIHGGGYEYGNASMFDGNDLINEAGGGVVAVLIQYRLGVFGFLPGQEVHDAGALNAGLLDQQFALQWVQYHISKFGGDPHKVTIWGESAGAGSVLQHIIANNGDTQPPLFRAAITSSVFLPSQYTFNDRIPQQLFAEVVNQTGCSSASDTLECLRQVDVNLLQQANTNITTSGFFGTLMFVPVVDGRFITKRPTQLLREGKINGEALLAVTNTFEGATLVNRDTASTLQIPSYLANMFPKFRDAEVTAGAAQYRNQGTPIDHAIAIMGESIFICPTYFLLRAFKGKAFRGVFALPPGIHELDIPYYFPSVNLNTLDTGIIPLYNNTTFINNFAQSFLNFVISMDPNVKWDPANTLPKWVKWDEEGRTEMLFNKTDEDVPVFRSIITAGGLLERCDFWHSVGAFSGQ